MSEQKRLEATFEARIKSLDGMTKGQEAALLAVRRGNLHMRYDTNEHVRIPVPVEQLPAFAQQFGKAVRVTVIVEPVEEAAAVKRIDAALHAGEPSGPVEPLRHAVNYHGDCAHWCRACAVEARARGES